MDEIRRQAARRLTEQWANPARAELGALRSKIVALTASTSDAHTAAAADRTIVAAYVADALKRIDDALVVINATEAELSVP